MPQISQAKKDKISEHILHHLFSIAPQSSYTSHIAGEIARDEEFTKRLLTNLLKKQLVICIKKNSSGILLRRRQRWRLSDKAYNAYKKHQQ
jgi:predicted transcriptional regulator with HTH domain